MTKHQQQEFIKLPSIIMLLMAEETKTPRGEKLTQNFLTDKWRENKI